MADWKNQVDIIINKIKLQLHSKKLDDLQSVQNWIQKFDTDNSGVLEKYEFEKFLGRVGIFLSTQELRAVYDVFDKNRDGKISYDEFIQQIRTQMSEKRLSIVKHAFQFIDSQGTGSIPLEVLYQKYNPLQHPRVLSKQKTVDQVYEEFKQSMSQKSSNQQDITENQFLDYYADVNATLPNEKEEYFVDLLIKTWSITSAHDYVSPERLADLEIILYEKIRQKTFTTEDEGRTLQKAFKYFDIENTGIISLSQFRQALEKFGCSFSQKEILALFNKYDKDRSGKVCFDEFCGLYATMGVGNNQNIQSTFMLERQIPKETIEKIQLQLQKNDNFDQLAQCLQKSDRSQSGILNRDQLRWSLKEAGLQITQTEFTNLLKFFDKQNNDQIDYQLFLSHLQ